MLTFDEYLTEQLKDSKFKAEWDALEDKIARLKEYRGCDEWEILADMKVVVEKCENE